MSPRARAAACEAARPSRLRDRARARPGPAGFPDVASRCVHAGNSDRSVRRSASCRLSERVRRRITPPPEPLRRRRAACRRPPPREPAIAWNRCSSTMRHSGLSRRRCRACRKTSLSTSATRTNSPRITGFNLHRGCLALAERPMDRSLDDVARQADLLLVLEGVTDARQRRQRVSQRRGLRGERGLERGVLRPAVPQGRSARRWAACCALRTRACADWPRDLAALKSEGFTVVALTPREDAIDLAAYARRRPHSESALLVGSEGPGLTAEAEAMADVLRAHPDPRRCRFAEPRNRHRHRTLLLHQSPIPNP